MTWISGLTSQRGTARAFICNYSKMPVKEWKDCRFNIATIQNISAGKHAGLTVSVPQLSEQTAILNLIHSEPFPM
jgi:hypothetical protein